MSHLKRDKKIKLVGSELDIFLTTEIGVLSWFNGTKIKFNPHPFSENKNLDEKDENLVDFHLDIIKKIDALLVEREKEVRFEEELERSLDEVVEMREQSRRKLEMSDFKVEVQPGNILENVFDDVDSEDELFEIEHLEGTGSDFKFVTGLEKPKDIRYIKRIESEHVKNRGFLSRMLGGRDKASKRSAIGFAHIKVRSKEDRTKPMAVKGKGKQGMKTSSFQNVKNKIGIKKTGKNNNFRKTRKELEKTRKEIEEKKKELEKAEREAKEKEKELTRNRIEKRRREKEEEKLKKLALKKAEIESKEKERETERAEKEKEKLKKLELKRKAREARLREVALRRAARVEEKKKLEAERILSEERLKRSLEREKKKVKEKRVAKSKKEPIDVLKVKKREDTKEKTRVSAPGLHHFILERRESKGEKQVDDDVKKVLIIVDDLLGELPEEVINEFVQSEDFALYEKVISKYKNKSK